MSNSSQNSFSRMFPNPNRRRVPNPINKERDIKRRIAKLRNMIVRYEREVEQFKNEYNSYKTERNTRLRKIRKSTNPRINKLTMKKLIRTEKPLLVKKLKKILRISQKATVPLRHTEMWLRERKSSGSSFFGDASGLRMSKSKLQIQKAILNQQNQTLYKALQTLLNKFIVSDLDAPSREKSVSTDISSAREERLVEGNRNITNIGNIKKQIKLFDKDIVKGIKTLEKIISKLKKGYEEKMFGMKILKEERKKRLAKGKKKN